jgi:hypothetical protein
MLGHRTMRSTLVGAVALCLAATAFAAVTATASSAAPTPRVPGCTTGGLVEWIDTQSNGAAGTIYYDLEFTNLSGHACTLEGYPGVSGITLSGSQIGSAADRDSTVPVHLVTIGAFKTAIAVLGITDVGVYSKSACHPTTAAGLRVYAPNQTVAKTIPFPFDACARAATHYLRVEAVES